MPVTIVRCGGGRGGQHSALGEVAEFGTASASFVAWQGCYACSDDLKVYTRFDSCLTETVCRLAPASISAIDAPDA